MRKFLAQAKGGKLSTSDYTKKTLSQFLKENEGMVLAIVPHSPESKKQRAFYHGAVLPLWAYLNDYDYRDGEVLEWLHNKAKIEFNGEIVLLDGKKVKRGKSTKGLLSENYEQNSGYLERIISYLEENYGIDRNKVLNPEHFKKFRDEIYSVSEYDDYILYLIDIGFLPRQDEITKRF